MKNLLNQVDHEKYLKLGILWKIFKTRCIMEDFKKQVDNERSLKVGR